MDYVRRQIDVGNLPLSDSRHNQVGLMTEMPLAHLAALDETETAMFGIWRSRWHYADPDKPRPDYVADTERELWLIKDRVAAPGMAHPAVAVLTENGQWRYLGWWRVGDEWTELDKRDDPHIYDQVRYYGKKWSGGDAPQPHVHPERTIYLSQH